MVGEVENLCFRCEATVLCSVVEFKYQILYKSI